MVWIPEAPGTTCTCGIQSIRDTSRGLRHEDLNITRTDSTAVITPAGGRFTVGCTNCRRTRCCFLERLVVVRIHDTWIQVRYLVNTIRSDQTVRVVCVGKQRLGREIECPVSEDLSVEPQTVLIGRLVHGWAVIG